MVNMKILDLPLKAKWYEMIESGNKKEEYREIKKYWIGRLAKCGCPNRCKWCVVPKKEGKISPYMDIEEITAGRKKLSLWIIIYWPQTMACSK